MKVRRLIIKNVGMIEDANIPIDKPLIIFFGDVRQGKTTLLNAVRWVFGGSFPQEIIKHGKKEANITLETDDGSITREFYKAKDGTTTAKPISFIRDGKPVKKPVAEIEKFLNPFLLDQDHLRKMTELERKTYFTQLFAVDTAEIDSEILKTENQGRELRAQVRGYGEIDLTEVKPVDITPMQAELYSIRGKHAEKIKEVNIQNRQIRDQNAKINSAIEDIERWTSEIKILEKKLEDLRRVTNDAIAFVNNSPKDDEIPLPDSPDTSSLESRIAEAAANEVRYEQYQKNVERSKEKLADEKRLFKLETQYRGLKKDKIAKLAKIGETCGIKNLAFDENGNFIYEGTSAGMLSGSQIMKLSEELSSLYPKDLGISLIDRAESLGKSVFLLIDRAKEEEKVILATVVGEQPAKIPEEVGVWIVDNGEVKKP